MVGALLLATCLTAKQLPLVLTERQLDAQQRCQNAYQEAAQQRCQDTFQVPQAAIYK